MMVKTFVETLRPILRFVNYISLLLRFVHIEYFTTMKMWTESLVSLQSLLPVATCIGGVVKAYSSCCLSSQTHSLGWPSAFGYGTPTPGGKRAGHPLWPYRDSSHRVLTHHIRCVGSELISQLFQLTF